LVKPKGRRLGGVQKGKAKGKAGRHRGPSRPRRKPETDETDEDEKFTYEGTFTLKADDL